MGAICFPNTPSNEIKVDEQKKKSIHIQVPTQLIQFAFTTQKLIHINSDMLIIFLDHSINIRKNDHFIKLPMQAAKLQQYAKAKLQKSKSSSQLQIQQTIRYITFQIMIPTLNYKYVSLIFCDAWDDSKECKLSFGTNLNNFYHSIDGYQCKSILITQFTSQLGIPLEKGMKIVVGEAMQLKNKPQKIQLCCLSEDSKQLLSGLINQNMQLLAASVDSAILRQSKYI